MGGFHRAHRAMYLDRLMEQGRALDWGICGVNVLARRVKEALDAQDCLYTLVVKHPDGTREPRVLGSAIECLYAPDHPELAIERMAAETTRVVSLTITEGGYATILVTGDFAPDAAALRDLKPGAVPATVFGLVTEALARRRSRGVPPFTVMSCDNIPGNGVVTRTAFVAFARLAPRGTRRLGRARGSPSPTPWSTASRR